MIYTIIIKKQSIDDCSKGEDEGEVEVAAFVFSGDGNVLRNELQHTCRVLIDRIIMEE